MSNFCRNQERDQNEHIDDSQLAREMNALSVQERAKILDDIHGVATPQEETPEFVTRCITGLDQAVEIIPKSKKKSLERAFFLRPSLRSNAKFKLMFLRADDYDVEKAASRMVKYFERKRKLFGEEKLGRDITLDDLDERDINAGILSGCLVELPNKDQAGRPILVFDISKFAFGTQENMLRCTWYILMSALEDEEAQIKGLTIVSYLPRKRQIQIPASKALENLMKSNQDISAALPVRATGYHFCTHEPALQFVLSLLRASHSKRIRLRMRSHFGSELEIQYSLLTFGIHCSSIFQYEDGKTELHAQYLERRREKESIVAKAKSEAEATTEAIDHPTARDALFGRGHPYHDFCGTRDLIKVIDSQLKRYFTTNDRFVKTCINMEIIRNLQESGGRLLRRTPTCWKLIDDTHARGKLSNLFRYRYDLSDSAVCADTQGSATKPRTKRLRYDRGINEDEPKKYPESKIKRRFLPSKV